MPRDNISKLLASEAPFFNISSIQALFSLTRESARTKASRLVQAGILRRISRDLYVLVGRRYSLFSLANALNQPSVISLETALNYWGLIVQVPQIIFSVALASRQYQIEETTFVYRKIEASLFRFGQVSIEDFYIAEPEKAFLDTLYMKSKGLAELLPEDVDTGRLDDELLEFYSRSYPASVRRLLLAFGKPRYETQQAGVF